MNERWRPASSDLVLAFAVGGFAVAKMVLSVPHARAADATALALIVLGSAVLVAHRRSPVTTLVVATACAVAYEASGYPGVAGAAPMCLALYSTTEAGRRLVGSLIAVTGLALGAAGSVVLVGQDTARDILDQHVLLAGWVVAAGVLGELARQRRAYVHEVERRAAEAERTRDEAARRHAVQERLRIARELHDSLTHTISVIKVQSGVAVHLARKRGEEVSPALVAIQEASTEATRELRHTLDVLRPDGATTDGVGTEGPSFVGTARLPELVERARATGLAVTLTTSGDPRELPPPADRAIYRIVQESLTNVTRHADASQVTIDLDHRGDQVLVRVTDDGRARPDAPPRPGMGLTGMRERVAALSGWLSAEPRPEGGFSVVAGLPLDGTPTPHGPVPELR